MPTKLDDSQINSTMLNTAVGDIAKIYASLLEMKGHLNYETTYIYNTDGQIQQEIINGDFNKTTTYTYYSTESVHAGKIETETIIEGIRSVTRTYQYDNVSGKITTVSTSVIIL